MNDKQSLTYSQLSAVLSSRLGQPTEKGFWKCFLHSDENPSLKIRKSDGTTGDYYFKCFQCSEYGDGYKFISLYDNLDIKNDFNKVVIETHKILGINGKDTTAKVKALKMPSKDRLNASERKKASVDIAQHVYKEFIRYTGLTDTTAAKYLDDRCINQRTSEQMKLRFVPYADRFKISNHFGNQIPRQTLIDSGMFKETDSGDNLIFLFPNQILIPWFFNGVLYGFQGRQISKESSKQYGKYKNSPFLPVLYVPPVAMPKENDLLITEGAIDTITHVSINGGRSVAIPSASISKDRLIEAGNIILSAKPKKIVFAIDADEAGQDKKKQLLEPGKEGQDPDGVSIIDFLTGHFIDNGFNGYRIKQVVFGEGIKDMNQHAVKQKTGLAH